MPPSVSVVSLAVALIVGIWCADTGAGPFAIACCLVPPIALWWRRQTTLLGVLAMIVWGLVGYARAFAVPNEPVENDTLVRLEAVVYEREVVRASMRDLRFGQLDDYTRLRVGVTTSTTRPLVGRELILYVAGHAAHAHPGDHVSCLGRVSVRPPLDNPGQRGGRYVGIPSIRVSHPKALTVRPATGIPRWRRNVRDGLSRTLRARISSPHVGIAETIVLGKREQLRDSVSEAFRQTGTGHLLAISGLHLGLAAGLILLLVRRLTRSTVWQTVIVCGLIVLYAILVEPRASVIRATVFVTLGGTCLLLSRSLASWTLLAIAAVVVLLIDPLQLFRPGAQLSFVAVAAIIGLNRADVITRLTPGWFQTETSSLSAATRRLLAIPWRLMLWGVLIWAATAPLTAYHFRWVTAWGALLHIVLMPLVTVLLGGLLLALGGDLLGLTPRWLWDTLDTLTGLLESVVQTVAKTDIGSWSLAEPSAIWLAALYAALFAAVVLRSTRVRQVMLASVAVLLVVGLTISLWPQRHDSLRVTTLSVGHGLCVVVQTPSGQTMLFDVGSLSNTQRAGMRITDALLALDVDAIDRVILSHADQDHFGSIAPVLETFPIGAVVCHQTFLDSRSRLVRTALEDIHRRAIPITVVSEGITFDMTGVGCRVLHPSSTDDFPNDNEDSLVMALEWAGRRILLTGDIERSGLRTLLQHEPLTCDVMLAPHHGAKSANTPELNTWAEPRAVIVSRGRPGTVDLNTIYPDSEIFETRLDGAVTTMVFPDGRLCVEGFHGRRWDAATLAVTVDHQRVRETP